MSPIQPIAPYSHFIFTSFSYHFVFDFLWLFFFKMDKTCASCKKIIKTKYDACEHCRRIYHPSCTTLTPVRNSHTVKACRSCIAEANANNKKRDSINGNNSTEHPTDTNSSSESPSASPSASHTGVQTTPCDPLQ